MIKLILIIDPRNLIFGTASTLNRHKVYSETLTKVTQDRLKLGVMSFQSREGFSIELIDNMYSIKISKSLIFQRKAWKSFVTEYKALFNTHLLVAGDPWESFLSATLFSRMTSRNSRIQVQAHGDIGNRLWIKLNWRNRIRSLIALLTLRFATEIRATTELQAKQLTSQYGVNPKKIFVVPVPSFYLSHEVALTLNSARPNSLGLVGRIEQDRGLDTFVELTKKLAQVNQDFSVVVVGSGNSRDKLENKLGQLLPPSRISFLGNIDPANMYMAWNKLGVLVSCAPAESYGRAMRESLVHGIPVWATQSSGAIDLFKLARDGMEFLNLSDSADELNETYGRLLHIGIDPSLRSALLKSDQQVISNLVSSWLESPVKS